MQSRDGRRDRLARRARLCAEQAACRRGVAFPRVLRVAPWPLSRRFSARHALAVHGLKKAGAHAWFAEQAATASHVPPRLSCRASPWAHQRSASWRLCTSLSACDDPGVPLEPSIGQLRNFSVPWVPGAVRDLCKLHASGRLGRSRSGVRSRGAENFTRRAR